MMGSCAKKTPTASRRATRPNPRTERKYLELTEIGELIVNARLLTCLFVTILSWTNSRDVPVKDILSVLGSTDTASVSTRIIPQEYFPQVKFVTIDTGFVKTDSFGRDLYAPEPGYVPMRIALDSSDRIFPLFGFPKCSFNDLVDAHPPDLKPNELYEYGRFFVRLTNIYTYPSDSSEFCFIVNVDQLKSMNRDNIHYFGTDPDFGNWDKKSRIIDSRIDSLAGILDVPHLSLDSTTGHYDADYFVWYLRTGVLREFSVQITTTGDCSMLRDTVAVDHVGYYDPYGEGIW
jgi:hypothetical protein